MNVQTIEEMSGLTAEEIKKRVAALDRIIEKSSQNTQIYLPPGFVTCRMYATEHPELNYNTCYIKLNKHMERGHIKKIVIGRINGVVAYGYGPMKMTTVTRNEIPDPERDVKAAERSAALAAKPKKQGRPRKWKNTGENHE